MRKIKKILTILTVVAILLTNVAVTFAASASTPYLEEPFSIVSSKDMNGYNGWSYANVYQTKVDDNEFTIEQESDESDNLVALIKKTGTNASVTDKTRKWISKDISIAGDTTKVTVQFRIKSTKAQSSEVFDVGFRGADGTWFANGHFRLLTGTNGNNFGVVKTNNAYDYYNKLNATKDAWNTVRIEFDKTTDIISAKVNGAASGSCKLSTLQNLSGNLPTAVGFGWNRAVADAEVMIDDITVVRDGASGYHKDDFESAGNGDVLTSYLDWSAANTYTDGTPNNLYTIKDDSKATGNKVANFYKGPTTGGSRLWASHPINLPADTAKMVISFKLRTNSGTGLFDVGFANGSEWAGNGNLRFYFDTNKVVWRPGNGPWESNANLDKTGAWNDIVITVEPGYEKNGAVRGMISLEINGTAAGSDYMNSTGLSKVYTPTAVGMGWFRAQEVGADLDIDDFVVSIPGAQAEEAGFTEKFELPKADSELAGFNGWTTVNEYADPKKDDNVYTIQPESEGSSNIVANFEKTITDPNDYNKNRKWVGKTFTVPAGEQKISAKFKIRRLGTNIGRFDIGFLGGSSWGLGDGVVGVYLTDSESKIFLVDKRWIDAPVLNSEAGVWHDIEIKFDYTQGKFSVYADDTLIVNSAIDITNNSHLVNTVPSGIAFGWQRGAAGTQVQIDDIVVYKTLDAHPTTISDITVENNKLSSITISNTAALKNATAYVAVYDKANGVSKLTSVACVPLTDANAAVGTDIVITPEKDISVPEGAVVKVFILKNQTFAPYSLAKVREKTAAIDYDGLSLTQDGDMSKNFTIHVIGDSTAASYGNSVYPLTGWAQVLDNYFTDNVTINDDAISGESSKTFYNIPAHWNTTINEVKEGDYVMIQFGHNDEKASGTSEVDNSETLYTSANGTYKEYLEKFIDETRAKGATPILVTSINRRAFDDKGNVSTSASNLMAYVNAMKEVAVAKDVALMDLNSKTKLLYEYYGVKGSNALFMNLKAGEYAAFPNGRTDNTHLREAGAHEVAKLLGVALVESGHELSGYLKH